jgi:putative hemolysin
VPYRGTAKDEVVKGPIGRFEHFTKKPPAENSPDAFARSVDKDEARQQRRIALIADRQHDQHDRILQYVTQPREYAQQSQRALRSTLDEHCQMQGYQREQARYEDALQVAFDRQYATALERTHRLRAEMRARQQAEAAEANRRAIEEKQLRKQRERQEEHRLDMNSNFMDRFGGSLK